MNAIWSSYERKPARSQASKKRKFCNDDSDNESDSSSVNGGGIGIEDLFKSRGSMYTSNNHIYFNDDVTQRSMFDLAKSLRQVASTLKLRALALGISVQPLYLHISTNGGEINAAFSVVDCIKGLGVPVYSVVDGFVASAGTLISLAAEKRFIQPNAYMLVHQLSSGVWGKMSTIEEQVDNLKKLMNHITTYYRNNTKLTAASLRKLLLTDVTWTSQESIDKGLVDELYDTAKL